MVGEEKITFGSRLRELRLAKGWSQYYLASRAGCTNSNISYLENHPNQQPKLETVEALAGALGWPINEARRLAGYPESDLNVTRVEVEDDFRYALLGYKQLSEEGQERVKDLVGEIIDFALKCERDKERLILLEKQIVAGPKSEKADGVELEKFDKRNNDKEKKGRKKK